MKLDWLLPGEHDFLSLKEIAEMRRHLNEHPPKEAAVEPMWDVRRIVATLEALVNLHGEKYDNLWNVVGRYQDDLKRAEVMTETYKRSREDCERRFEEFVTKFSREAV